MIEVETYYATVVYEFQGFRYLERFITGRFLHKAHTQTNIGINPGKF